MNELNTFLQNNSLNNTQLLDAVYKDILELIFKEIVNKLEYNKTLYKQVKDLYFKNDNELLVVNSIVLNICYCKLSNKELEQINIWLKAFLNKRDERQDFPIELRRSLYKNQNGKCNLCHKQLKDNEGHIDHIIPFSYVGDEIDDNYQLLCNDCNWSKSNFLGRNVLNLIKYNERNL